MKKESLTLTRTKLLAIVPFLRIEAIVFGISSIFIVIWLIFTPDAKEFMASMCKFTTTMVERLIPFI